MEKKYCITILNRVTWMIWQPTVTCVYGQLGQTNSINAIKLQSHRT